MIPDYKTFTLIFFWWASTHFFGFFLCSVSVLRLQRLGFLQRFVSLYTYWCIGLFIWLVACVCVCLCVCCPSVYLLSIRLSIWVCRLALFLLWLPALCPSLVFSVYIIVSFQKLTPPTQANKEGQKSSVVHNYVDSYKLGKTATNVI
jgi:hypothetical protein